MRVEDREVFYRAGAFYAVGGVVNGNNRIWVEKDGEVVIYCDYVEQAEELCACYDDREWIREQNNEDEDEDY